MSQYRPWGLLAWLLPRCSTRENWALLGSLSTGERSLAAWRTLRNGRQLGQLKLLRIANKRSRHDLAINQREGERIREFESEGGDTNDIEAHYLLEPPSDIVDVIYRFLRTCGPNVVLDVSTLPKRFFFPILKLLLKETVAVPNLMVTYTSPVGHTREKLAENPDQWDHIPLFSGSYTTVKPTMMVINVGFEGMGLQEQVDQGEAGLPVKLLFPFPATPQAFRRSWELVHRLQQRRSHDDFQIYRTDAKEVGDAFDRLVSLSDHGNQRTILAPFGPKPISVAMCIFAAQTESQVFYTQPTVYHPNYSYGVGDVGGVPAVWAYCLRLDGNEYYQI
jgi:hypothetical protein